jgi:hypothetical protein
MDAKYTVSKYIEEHKNNPGNSFLGYIRKTFEEGKLDHNIIRRAVLNRLQAKDKTSVFFGSLLLQLDNKEIHELLNEKL